MRIRNSHVSVREVHGHNSHMDMEKQRVQRRERIFTDFGYRVKIRI